MNPVGVTIHSALDISRVLFLYIPVRASLLADELVYIKINQGKALVEWIGYKAIAPGMWQPQAGKSFRGPIFDSPDQINSAYATA